LVTLGTSPAAGMGGSLAIIGATVLADAFALYQDDYQLVFDTYNKNLRPFIEEVQDGAVQTLDKLLPGSGEEVKTMWKDGISF
jgi:2-polyprenyl-6-methoxyphenol hydroxylase-like FAD-dependent oxidoreductase